MQKKSSGMKRIWQWGWLALLLLMSMGLVACGGGSPAPAPLSPEVDTQAIVAEVLAQLEAEAAMRATIEPVLFEPTVTPPPPPTAVPTPIIESNLATSELEQTLIELYKRANPAVVYIIVPPLGTGSGFVHSANSDGVYIVTNNHVIANGSSYEVIFADGTRQRGELVGADVDSDLAVLRVAALPEGVEPLELADADSIDVGQFVIAIGNPFGEQGSMSLGIISALGRSLSSQRDIGGGARYSLPGVIQTDAPINPGNSGGPLLNLRGEVVGVNSAIASMTGTNSGVGFAIPVQAVHRIVPNLISDGRHNYSFMGGSFDSEITLAKQELYNLPQTAGAYLLTVQEGSPADQAGLRGARSSSGAGGDLIIAIDGTPINSFDDLNSYLVFNSQAGQTIEITVIRDREEVTISLTLGARP